MAREPLPSPQPRTSPAAADEVAGEVRLGDAGVAPLPPISEFRQVGEHDLAHDRGHERPGPEGGQTALLPLAEGPCPSCTALVDQLEGAAEHVSQRVTLAVAGKAPLQRILAFAGERGWRRLSLLSSARTTYHRDYFAE